MTRITQRRRVALGFSLLILGALMASAAHAGQVRVTVNNNFFSPYAVNINQGDHVVWVWLGNPHTVTSWDSAAVDPNGAIFDSQPSHVGQNNTTRFSWKSTGTGHVPYVCVPHIGEPMAGRVIISPLVQPPTIQVADFRLTEVQFNVPGGQDLVEISNLGGAAGDLQSYRLAVAGTGTGVAVSATSFPVSAQGRVVVHTSQAGTNGVPPGHIYMALGDLNDVAGSLSLYVPSTVTAQSAVTNAALMLDFVQWGAGGQANEATAGSVNFWTAGQSIDGVAPGHSIEYCADPNLGHGIDRWAEIFPTNFGSNNDCADPVLTQTWGRLKTLYRP